MVFVTGRKQLPLSRQSPLFPDETGGLMGSPSASAPAALTPQQWVSPAAHHISVAVLRQGIGLASGTASWVT